MLVVFGIGLSRLEDVPIGNIIPSVDLICNVALGDIVPIPT